MIRSYEIVAHYSDFFKRNEKIMPNSEIEPFPSYSPSKRTNIYNIFLINYRWRRVRVRAPCPIIDNKKSGVELCEKTILMT